MTQKLIDFIKYNNAFVIGLTLVLFGGGVIFAASPDARDAVLGKEIVTEQGVDNSRIINADLENFDFQMKIDNVTEDQANYYVDYSFRTIGVEGNEWQTITRSAKMTVAKESLAGQDLGLYVQAQLANIAQNELAYLKQAQAAEKEKGLTQVVRTTEYTGLIGLVLDVKNAVLPGYEPVIKPELVDLAQNIETLPPETPEIPIESESDRNATTTIENTADEPPANAEMTGQNQDQQISETQFEINGTAQIPLENPAPSATETETEPDNATSTISTP